MRHKILALKKKLDKFEEWLACPRLYVAENSASLRNEIDIGAETLINEACQNSRVQISAKHEQINENRKLMIAQVDENEKDILKELTTNTLDVEYASQISLEIQKYNNDLQKFETNGNEDILSDLESAIDMSIYEFGKKINKGFSLLFLTVDELNMCINEEKEASDEKCFFEENPSTTFGFLYVLDDYISKENFK